MKFPLFTFARGAARMGMLIAGAAAPAAASQTEAVLASQALEPGLAIDTDLSAEQPSVAARYAVRDAGWLYVGARCDGAEIDLRVESVDAQVLGSATGWRPLVQLAVESGQELSIRATALEIESGASLWLRVSEAPTTPEIDALAARGAELVRELKTRYAGGDFDGARTLLQRSFETLASNPRVRRSKAGADVIATVVVRAADLGEMEIELQASRWTAEYFEHHCPPGHATLQEALENLASSLTQARMLPEALEVRQRVVGDYRAYLPEEDDRIQQSCVGIAVTLGYMDRDDEARVLFERVLEIETENLPADHPSLSITRGSFAGTLLRIGDAARARELLEPALRAQESEAADDDNDLQITRMNLAVARNRTGDTRGARALQERVLDIYTKKLPDDHPELLSVRNNLAATRYNEGDFLGALALFAKVAEVAERTLPPGDSLVLSTRWNLAATLEVTGDYDGARALYERVIADAPTDSSMGSDRLRGKCGVAQIAFIEGDVDKARRLLEEVLEVYGRTLAPGHFELTTTQSSLAACLARLGEPEQALQISERVLAVREEMLPASDKYVLSARYGVLCDLAVLGETERARPMLAALVEGVRAGLRLASQSFSVREAEAAAAATLSTRGLFPVLNAARGLAALEPLDEFNADAFELVETARGIGIASLRCQRAAAGAAYEPTLQTARAEIAQASREVADLAWSGARSERLQEAVLAKGRAERELRNALADALGDQGLLPDLSPETVARVLAPEQVFVGYWTYDLDTSRVDERPGASYERVLLAFVLAADGTLQRVELGPIRAVEDAVTAWRDSLGVPSETARTRAVAHEGDDAGVALRELVFDPVRACAPDAERWVVALDEVLHLFPMDALPLEGGVVGDLLQINVRPTLAEFVATKAPITSQPVLFAMGGIDYQAPASRVAGGPVGMLVSRGSSAGSFRELPETESEVHRIGETFSEAFGESSKATLLFGNAATKQALVHSGSGARFLHLATHGFFARAAVEPTATQDAGGDRAFEMQWDRSLQENVRGMSPMVLCGLALAGANQADPYGSLPGVITAEELGTIDLSRCELAVLSACDTHVGQIDRAGQGVASLQKALHAAGARAVVTSLWQVSDEAASALMVEFYRGIWVAGLPKADALWRAKRLLREERVPTRDWAGWVLSGDPD